MVVCLCYMCLCLGLTDIVLALRIGSVLVLHCYRGECVGVPGVRASEGDTSPQFTATPCH